MAQGIAETEVYFTRHAQREFNTHDLCEGWSLFRVRIRYPAVKLTPPTSAPILEFQAIEDSGEQSPWKSPSYLSAVRTPIGKFMGGLSPLTAPELGAKVVAEAVRRAGIEPEPG